MKKLICLILSLTMLLGLVACDFGNSETTTQSSTSTTESTTTESNSAVNETTTESDTSTSTMIEDEIFGMSFQSLTKYYAWVNEEDPNEYTSDKLWGRKNCGVDVYMQKMKNKTLPKIYVDEILVETLTTVTITGTMSQNSCAHCKVSYDMGTEPFEAYFLQNSSEDYLDYWLENYEVFDLVTKDNTYKAVCREYSYSNYAICFYLPEYEAIIGFYSYSLKKDGLNEAVKNGTVAEYANEIFANVRIETCE